MEGYVRKSDFDNLIQRLEKCERKAEEANENSIEALKESGDVKERELNIEKVVEDLKK